MTIIVNELLYEDSRTVALSRESQLSSVDPAQPDLLDQLVTLVTVRNSLRGGAVSIYSAFGIFCLVGFGRPPLLLPVLLDPEYLRDFAQYSLGLELVNTAVCLVQYGRSSVIIIIDFSEN